MCPNCRKPRNFSIRKGSFRRSTGKCTFIQRYFCKACNKHYSDQTGTLTYRERKPQLTQRLFILLAMGNSMRGSSFILNIHRRTVERKLRRLGRFASKQQERYLRRQKKFSIIVFDEMETIEHTKCKPLSITLAVEEGTRRILFAEAARMPAKGLLASLSRKRYGYRKDDRPESLRRMLTKLKPLCVNKVTIKTDMSPRYPKYISEVLKEAVHEPSKGRRAAVVGQGELKVGKYDPLFSLNHSCAMFRDHLKTLTRRTWCTIKRPERFQDLLNIYTCFHNHKIDGKRRYEYIIAG